MKTIHSVFTQLLRADLASISLNSMRVTHQKRSSPLNKALPPLGRREGDDVELVQKMILYPFLLLSWLFTVARVLLIIEG